MTSVVLSDPMPPLFHELSEGRFAVRPLLSASEEDYAAAEAIVAYSHPIIDGRLLDRCRQLKVISNHGVGVDHIDVSVATERGIPVGNTPGCLDASTADMTIALLMSVARNVVVGDAFARSDAFTHYDPALLIGREVTGSTLGIVGMGRIGMEVAKRARAFDMKVLYHNRTRRENVERKGQIEFADLNELLQTSDFVSLNCPLSSATQGLIGREQLHLMKRSAILINMARGPVVQTDALYDALESGQISAAGLDVTDPEPLPRDHPLLKLNNVVFTPHLGSASDQTRRRMMQMTIDNLDAGLSGQPLPHAVTAAT